MAQHQALARLPVHAPRSAPRLAPRQPEFLIQLMVGGDPELRRALGRRDIADSRESAYSRRLAELPSRMALAPRLLAVA